MPKVSELRKRFPDKDIEVDGGVGPKTIDACAEAGEHHPCPPVINNSFHVQEVTSSLLGLLFSGLKTLKKLSLHLELLWRLPKPDPDALIYRLPDRTESYINRNKPMVAIGLLEDWNKLRDAVGALNLR